MHEDRKAKGGVLARCLLQPDFAFRIILVDFLSYFLLRYVCLWFLSHFRVCEDRVNRFLALKTTKNRCLKRCIRFMHVLEKILFLYDNAGMLSRSEEHVKLFLSKIPIHIVYKHDSFLPLFVRSYEKASIFTHALLLLLCILQIYDNDVVKGGAYSLLDVNL